MSSENFDPNAFFDNLFDPSLFDTGIVIPTNHPPPPSPVAPSSKRPRPSPESEEVIPRPRGRPRGSKNKSKSQPPNPPTPSASSEMACTPVLRIAAGRDIVESLLEFRDQQKTGFSINSCVGRVSNVTLEDTGGARIVCDGTSEVHSLAGVYVPPSMLDESFQRLTLTLFREEGKVDSGVVVGPLVAAGPVLVVLDPFVDPIIYNVPAQEEVVSPAPLPSDFGAEDMLPMYGFGMTSDIWSSDTTKSDFDNFLMQLLPPSPLQPPLPPLFFR